MKKVLVLGLLLGFANVAFADVYVNGYYRKDGTYVQPHHRSNSDGNFYNNYSTQGNVNPYTGQTGYKTHPQNYNNYNSTMYQRTHNYGY